MATMSNAPIYSTLHGTITTGEQHPSYHGEYNPITNTHRVWRTSANGKHAYLGEFADEQIRTRQYHRIYRLPGDKPLLHNGKKPR